MIVTRGFDSAIHFFNYVQRCVTSRRITLLQSCYIGYGDLSGHSSKFLLRHW